MIHRVRKLENIYSFIYKSNKMTKWSQSKYATSGQKSWPICYSWIFFFKLELGNKVNSFWVVETERVNWKYKATPEKRKVHRKIKTHPLPNRFNIKQHNTNLSDYICLKMYQIFTRKRENDNTVNVTNLVGSWVQHKWLAFLFCVNGGMPEYKECHYFKPGQHLFSPGKNKAQR